MSNSNWLKTYKGPGTRPRMRLKAEWDRMRIFRMRLKAVENVRVKYISPSFILILNRLQEKQWKMYFLICQVMFIMMPQILKFADSWKKQKSKYLENETYFFFE